MICVVEVRTVLMDDHAVTIMLPMRSMRIRDNTGGDTTVSSETVRGERFTNVAGDTVCIGMSRQAQKALGLPFKAFEHAKKVDLQQREEILALGHKLRECRKKLKKYRSMTFVQRLRFLFSRTEGSCE